MKVNDPRITSVDFYIAERKRELASLEFDDPKFEQTNDAIIYGYKLISEGEMYIIHF